MSFIGNDKAKGNNGLLNFEEIELIFQTTSFVQGIKASRKDIQDLFPAQVPGRSRSKKINGESIEPNRTVPSICQGNIFWE